MKRIEVTSDVVKKELEYRQKKRWDIFSWSSTILVAIIGGAIALQKDDGLWYGYRIVISLAVVTLAWFAVGWLSYHRKREKILVAQYFDEETKVLLLGNPFFGYRPAVVFLAIAALLATWLPFGCGS